MIMIFLKKGATIVYSACKNGGIKCRDVGLGFLLFLECKMEKKVHLLSTQIIIVIISHCRDFNCDWSLTFPH